MDRTKKAVSGKAGRKATGEKAFPGPGEYALSASGIPLLVEEIRAGYPVERLEHLGRKFGLKHARLLHITGMSAATLHRRKTHAGRLTPLESERLFRLQKLYETALEALQTPENVKTWFATPQKSLGGRPPLEFSDTQPGSEEVERMLRRMEHGIVP
jgi:putative toxin-antitoxin system antitoxin component (TIGR02293 family)